MLPSDLHFPPQCWLHSLQFLVAVHVAIRREWGESLFKIYFRLTKHCAVSLLCLFCFISRPKHNHDKSLLLNRQLYDKKREVREIPSG